MIGWIVRAYKSIVMANLVRRFIKIVRDMIREIEEEKRLKEKLNEIRLESDPTIRAKRLDKFFNS